MRDEGWGFWLVIEAAAGCFGTVRSWQNDVPILETVNTIDASTFLVL